MHYLALYSILGNDGYYFYFILANNFSIQIPTDYLFYSLLSLNIIFQFIFYGLG